jgi:hypothetical protein
MPVICPTCQIFRQKARSADFTRNDPVASRELRFGFDNWTLRYTDTRVSLDSQLTDPSARTFVVAASPLSPLSPLHLVDPGECMDTVWFLRHDGRWSSGRSSWMAAPFGSFDDTVMRPSS